MKSSIHQSNTILSNFIFTFCNTVIRQQAKSSIASKALTNSKAIIYSKPCCQPSEKLQPKKMKKKTSFHLVFSFFLTHTKIIYFLIKHIHVGATIHICYRPKNYCSISLKDKKNLLEKEEETHNIVMAKYTQRPKISKLGSFGEINIDFKNIQNVLLLNNLTKS
jgi:hypothetical protein